MFCNHGNLPCNGTFQGYHGNTINSCLYYVSIFPGCNVTCVFSYLSIHLPVCVYLSVCLPVCGSDHLPGPSVQTAGGGDSDRHQRRWLIGWRLPARWHHDHQRPRQRPRTGRPQPPDRAQRRQVCWDTPQYLFILYHMLYYTHIYIYIYI